MEIEEYLKLDRIVQAKVLKVPRCTTLRADQKDLDWLAAFEWYNKNYRSENELPFRMGCVPCYGKVREALITAKENIAKWERGLQEKELREKIDFIYNKMKANDTRERQLLIYLTEEEPNPCIKLPEASQELQDRFALSRDDDAGLLIFGILEHLKKELASIKPTESVASSNDPFRDHKMDRANTQSFMALVNAFKTIDAFAIPSLTPNAFSRYCSVKDDLIERYMVKEQQINPYTHDTYHSPADKQWKKDRDEKK